MSTLCVFFKIVYQAISESAYLNLSPNREQIFCMRQTEVP